MANFYALMARACTVLAVVMFALALIAVPSQGVQADPGDPVEIGPVCTTQCACATPVGQPCYYGSCGGTPGNCGTSCGCTGSDQGGDCSCVGYQEA